MRKLILFFAALLGLAGLSCLGMFAFKGGGAGKLVWEDPVVRKSIMTFGYKIYSDPAAENGRFFLSKIVFRNDGTAPVHDLSVSYQIPDYVSWTTPATQSEVPAGQTLVSLYYPQLPSKVTSLTNRTNATLETKIRWADKAGDVKEEILRNNIIFRGVNEIEYCDLPENEVADFYDLHSTAEFAVAMVTPNDPVVKEFVAEVTKRTGGTLAGIEGGKELVQTMKAMYDYMCETGMRYTSAEGVPTKVGDVNTYVQTVRMPRDVIITNEGLCVELALLWASAMEHLGCETDVIFIPGHAFTIVSAGQQSIPIECTAITPKSVQGSLKALGLSEDTPVVPFEKAVQLAEMEMEMIKKNNQSYIVYNVKAYQQQGMHAPELPEIDIEKIKNILAQRSAHTAASYAQNAGSARHDATPNAQVAQGYYRWVGINNSVAVDVPESWSRVENGPIPGMIFTAQDAQTSVAVNVFHFPTLATPAEAMQVAKKGVAKVAGGTVRIASQQPKGNMIVYTGTTSYRNGSTEWVGMFEPTQQGVVGMFVGAAKGHIQRNQPVIQQIISSFRVAGTGNNAQENSNEEQ
ncbi:MAG: hypothetical protein DLM52_01565 [Chthoniobacterales bacterium]|nr:MAG: hypothetical protein DLM52_01565 [Chthoniobacterales bacterium]